MASDPNYDREYLVTVSTATTTAAIAAAADRRASVYGMRISAGGTGIVTIQSGSTVLERFNVIAGSNIILPLRVRPYFKTAVNEALNVVTSAAVQVDVRFEATVA